MTTFPNPYRGFRVPAEIIEHAVWLYHCFSLSLRDVETNRVGIINWNGLGKAMATPRQHMALTAALVAGIARAVEDAGPSPGAIYLTDAEYDTIVRETLAQAPSGDLWLFGYGSLLWKPGFDYTERQMATVRGWHRSFCIKVARIRGTRDLNGLMMALDRGGQCRGMIFRIPADQAQAVLHTLFRRELVVKPPGAPPRWLTAQTDEGPICAIGFVVDRRSKFYSGKLSLEEVADTLSMAAGHWGTCAEYLHNTVSHLEEIGIHDRNLWRL